MERRSGRDGSGALDGARLLVVEDEFIILLELESVLLEAGAEKVCLCGTVAAALDCVEREKLGAAILDVRVGRTHIDPVARALDRRGVPFVFYTGQGETDPVSAAWPGRRIISKPAPAQEITATLAGLIVDRERSAAAEDGGAAVRQPG